MGNASNEERRTSRRVVVDLEVEERTDGVLYFQRATSLSLTGVFLEHTLPHPPGTRVTLEVLLPNDPSPLLLRGEVVTSFARQVGMAIRFLEAPAAELQRLADFLARAPYRVHNAKAVAS